MQDAQIMMWFNRPALIFLMRNVNRCIFSGPMIVDEVGTSM
jgi:hypothetical protein